MLLFDHVPPSVFTKRLFPNCRNGLRFQQVQIHSPFSSLVNVFIPSPACARRFEVAQTRLHRRVTIFLPTLIPTSKRVRGVKLLTKYGSELLTASHCLPCARLFAKYFAHMSSFNVHNNPMSRHHFCPHFIDKYNEV